MLNKTDPGKLNASRVYFTEFDRVTYSQVAWTPSDVEGIKPALIRKLKLLALTKGHVVIAASHLLESELARELLLPHPELFSERIVVPALREEFPTCVDFMESKQHAPSQGEAELYCGADQSEMAQLIDDSARPVKWNTAETSTWFKSRLLSDLRNPNSLPGLMLSENGLSVPESMCSELENTASLSRGAVYSASQQCGELTFREIITSYADFLYYLSGARAVDSEGILPQENIVDFRLSDLSGAKTNLSEHEVFFKIFVDLVKTSTSTYFPTDLLDAITVEDSIELHRIAVEASFVEKYNDIQTKTKAGLMMTDPERLVFLMHELEELERELWSEYRNAIYSELPLQHRKLMKRRAAQFIHSVASVIITPYGLVMGTKDILVSGLRLISLDGIASRIESRIEKSLRGLESAVAKTTAGQKPILLQYIDKLKSRYASKMLGPQD
ncbi:MAG: hypothetical protein OEV80_17805 [candidate division Zixibacteria bacterium]|nr:hypothetical protein [candidate division Zixibacteria bacterium]